MSTRPSPRAYSHRVGIAYILCTLCMLVLLPVLAFGTPVGIESAHSHSLPHTTALRDSARLPDSVHISGIVRNYDTDAPIANVRIHATETTGLAITEKDGRYTITLPVGSHPLQFTHPGYQPITIVVLADGEKNATVDVSLTPLPERLPSVRVTTTRPPRIHPDSLPGVASRPRLNAYGGQMWSQAAMRAAPQLDQSDLFRLLGTAPIAAAPSESPSSLHFGGGAADQNLVLLDGIPIENAVHSGWITSAIDPAVIENMTLYADHTPARFGGRLSSVIELHTRGTARQEDTLQTTDTARARSLRGSAPEPVLSGIVGSNEIAMLAAGSNTATGASGLISIRHSPREFSHFWPQQKEFDFLRHSGWFDGFAHGAIPAVGGTLSALVFQSRDALPFNTTPTPFTVHTGFEWRSSAFGSTWTGALTRLDSSTVTLRAWQSNTETHGAWSIYTRDLTLMTNALTQGGVSADVHTTRQHLEVHTGLMSERFRTSYIVTPYTVLQNVISTAPASRLSLAGLLATTSAYTDMRWCLSDRWTMLPGARVTYQSQPNRNGWQFEPRIGVSFSSGSHVQVAAYYSRTSQQLQSLRNEENTFDGIVGLNLLSVQNDRIPMATSTTFASTMTAALSQTLTTTVGAYSRRLHDIVVAPHTGNAPFLSDSLTSGTGVTHGGYATLTHTTPRLIMAGSLRVMTTRFSAAQVRDHYQPEFASTRFASFALGWHANRWTEIHTFLVTVGGRRAPLTQTPFSADLKDNLGTPKQDYGSATTIDPGSQKLPPYLTMNVGMSRTLSFARFKTHDGAGLRVFGAVDNVFNRDNVIGVKEQSTGVPNSPFFRYRPRTFMTGLDWQW